MVGPTLAARRPCAAAPAVPGCGWRSTSASRSTSALQELLATGAERIAAACPFCYIMVDDGVKSQGVEDDQVKVGDIAIHLLEAIERRAARAEPGQLAASDRGGSGPPGGGPGHLGCSCGARQPGSRWRACPRVPWRRCWSPRVRWSSRRSRAGRRATAASCGSCSAPRAGAAARASSDRGRWVGAALAGTARYDAGAAVDAGELVGDRGSGVVVDRRHRAGTHRSTTPTTVRSVSVKGFPTLASGTNRTAGRGSRSSGARRRRTAPGPPSRARVPMGPLRRSVLWNTIYATFIPAQQDRQRRDVGRTNTITPLNPGSTGQPSRGPAGQAAQAALAVDVRPRRRASRSAPVCPAQLASAARTAHPRAPARCPSASFTRGSMWVTRLLRITRNSVPSRTSTEAGWTQSWSNGSIASGRRRPAPGSCGKRGSSAGTGRTAAGAADRAVVRRSALQSSATAGVVQW